MLLWLEKKLILYTISSSKFSKIVYVILKSDKSFPLNCEMKDTWEIKPNKTKQIKKPPSTRPIL